VLSLIAAALAVAAPAPAATPSPALDASAPWWEKITKTIDEDGTERSCKYETSLSPQSAEACEAEGFGRTKARAAGGPMGLTSKLTFERRFSPGGRLDAGRLQPGDKLLTRHVMFLTIDPAGAVQSCRVVAAVGDLASDYGCAEAKAERFQARASNMSEATRQAFMTVLVYGHTEQIA
jgi:hypothetical protein